MKLTHCFYTLLWLIAISCFVLSTDRFTLQSACAAAIVPEVPLQRQPGLDSYSVPLQVRIDTAFAPVYVGTDTHGSCLLCDYSLIWIVTGSALLLLLFRFLWHHLLPLPYT
ncbi:MAG: hypothetical protein V4543_08400 [Bacteroidota bacterium]